MKITMEIPDNTVLATVSLALPEKGNSIGLGTFHILTKDLVDGNTVDFKQYYKGDARESEDTE